MSKPLIAVTGRNGQLGNAIEELSKAFSNDFDFLFTDKDGLDISDPENIVSFFKKNKPAYFLHCAAYTAVDKAETEQATAYTINAEANGIIAQQCRLINSVLMVISTDYVFDGKATRPYRPDDKTDPVNYYGYTKWVGEKLAIENNPHTIVIRTSWVYSTHGHNFVKTMLRLMKEKKEISVVNDQSGSPTYAADLAGVLLTIINALEKGNRHFGIYHYSNQGSTTWYDFAVAIRDIAGLKCTIHPIPTSAFPTPAKRPAYSLMDISAIQKDFDIQAIDWQESLRICLRQISSSCR
jgi:dTDP-4-dehydrorhamnose reductase